MPEIKTITRYVYRSEEFKTLNHVKEAIENEIGANIIDKFDNHIPRKNYLKVLEVLTQKENRKLLTSLLNVTYEEAPDNGDFGIETRNILDL